MALVLSACGGRYEYNGTTLEPPKELYDLTGTNLDGTTFRLSDQRGRVLLVFFGYTFCPDVCPMTLAEMVALDNLLGDKAEDVDIVFVSVDPERDTVERLAEYVSAFNPDFYGLHIPEGPDLETAKFAFGAWAEKNEISAAESSAGYLVDHTAWVYVVNQEGKLHEIFSFETTAEEMLPDIEYILKSG
jgi:protein SCO1/2